MEILFKLVLDRPAIELSEPDSKIELSQDSDYQAALASSIDNPDPRGVLRNASRQFVKLEKYSNSPEALAIHDRLRTFSSKLDDLEVKAEIPHAELKMAVEASFGASPESTLNLQEYKDAVSSLRDSIIAIKQLAEEHQQPIEKLAKALRDLEVVRKIATDDSFPVNGFNLRRFRRRPMKLPSQANLQSLLRRRKQAREDEEQRRKEAEAKLEKLKENVATFKQLNAAIVEIMALDTDHLESTKQTEDQGAMPPDQVRPLSVFVADIARKKSLGDLQVLNAKTQIEKGENVGTLLLEKDITERIQPTTEARRLHFSGVGAFKPAPLLANAFRFKAGSENLLSAETNKTLKKRSLEITTMAVDKVVSVLRAEMDEVSDELEELTKDQVTQSFARVGKGLVVTTTPTASAWGIMTTPDLFRFPSLDFLVKSVPDSKGDVAPAGVADLLVVKQHLKRYEAVDVAHIENVLRGESKVREHRRLRQTEETTFTEVETTRVEERELESTDRFEMTRETSKTIQQDASLKAGLTVSGSYGPSVKFSASAEGSISRSKEEATKTASRFSQDVTERSSEQLTERILERVQLKVTNEVEETNKHTLDNVSGPAHVSGVYQWVEKVYEAQMFNYGMRMLFDFMIPEPGAFLIEVLKRAHADAMEVEKPLPFTLQPNQIKETNYNYWTHQYAAQGIEPPPEEYITKAVDYSAGGGDEKIDYNHSGVIQIDEGYKAVQEAMGWVWNQWSDKASLDVVVGRRSHRFIDNGQWVWTTSLHGETDSIAFGLNTNEVSDLAVSLEVKLQRTERAMKKWRLDTHAKLMDAYQARLAEYEEKLAALELQAGVEIEGKNPKLNLEIMKDELKKNCISILTDQHYDLFNAIQNGSNGLPQINLDENDLEGPYVRFFEQAFEWEQITWVTYPYFWGRKSKWRERIAFDDPDPLFNQFIKAGYCRAVVPVRPGFEGAVDHFLTFGEIWNGGPLPTVSDPHFLAISAEIAERLDQPGNEIPQGEPWEVRVPTSLVHLRPDDKLPRWKKDEDGNWVPE